MHVYSGSPSALGRRRFYPDPRARTSLFSRELRRARIKTTWGPLDRLEKPLEEFPAFAAVELDSRIVSFPFETRATTSPGSTSTSVSFASRCMRGESPSSSRPGSCSDRSPRSWWHRARPPAASGSVFVLLPSPNGAGSACASSRSTKPLSPAAPRSPSGNNDRQLFGELVPSQYERSSSVSWRRLLDPPHQAPRPQDRVPEAGPRRRETRKTSRDGRAR